MKLLSHQKKGLEIARKRDAFAYFWDTGTGKTVLGLSLIRDKAVRTLVVVPYMLIRDAWLGDAQRFYPDLWFEMTNWHDIKHKKDRWHRLNRASVLVVNYESLLHNPDILIKQQWDMLIMDESQKIKDPKARITKLLTKHGSKIPHRYLLSGTPAPNNEIEYWGQLRILMPDRINWSWYKFRMQYFIPADRFGWKWKLRPDKKEEFESLLKECAWFLHKDEVLDLKGQHFRTLTYSLSKKELKVYMQMKRDLLAEIDGEEVSAMSAVTKLMKLREILSGFAFADAGGVVEIGTSKLRALRDFVELIPQQYIVWIQYVYEARQIERTLKDCAVIIGDTPARERERILESFRKGNIQVLVAHPKTLGHGITLTNVSAAIYYSLGYSYEEFKQSQDRIYRYGQESPVTYYIMQSEQGLIDTKILSVLERKESNMLKILNLLREEACHGKEV